MFVILWIAGCFVAAAQAEPLPAGRDLGSELALANLLRLGQEPVQAYRYTDCLLAKRLSAHARGKTGTEFATWFAGLAPPIGERADDLIEALGELPAASTERVSAFDRAQLPDDCKLPVRECGLTSAYRPGGSPPAWLGGQVRQAALALAPWIALRLAERDLRCSKGGDEDDCTSSISGLVCEARSNRERFFASYHALNQATATGALTLPNLDQALDAARKSFPELEVRTEINAAREIDEGAVVAASERLTARHTWPKPDSLLALSARFWVISGEAVASLRQRAVDIAKQANVEVTKSIKDVTAPLLQAAPAGEIIVKGRDLCLLAVPESLSAATQETLALAIAAPIPPATSWPSGEDCETARTRMAVPIGLTIPSPPKDDLGRWRFPAQLPIAGALDRTKLRALLLVAGLPPWLETRKVSSPAITVVDGGKALAISLSFELGISGSGDLLANMELFTPAHLEFSKNADTIRGQVAKAVAQLRDSAAQHLAKVRVAVPDDSKPLLMVDHFEVVDAKGSSWLETPPRLHARLTLPGLGSATVALGVVARDGQYRLSFEAQELSEEITRALIGRVREVLEPIIDQIGDLEHETRHSLQDIGLHDVRLEADGAITAIVHLALPRVFETEPPQIKIVLRNGKVETDAAALWKTWIEQSIDRVKAQAEAEAKAALGRAACDVQRDALAAAKQNLPANVTLRAVDKEPEDCPAAIQVLVSTRAKWALGILPIRLGLADKSRVLDFRDARLFKVENGIWRPLDVNRELNALVADEALAKHVGVVRALILPDGIHVGLELRDLPYVGTLPLGDVVLGDRFAFECNSRTLASSLSQRLNSADGNRITDALSALGGTVSNLEFTDLPICGGAELALTASVRLGGNVEVPARIMLLPTIRLDFDKEALKGKLAGEVLRAVAGLTSDGITFGDPVLSPLSVPFKFKFKFLGFASEINGLVSGDKVRLTYPVVIGLGPRISGSVVSLPVDFVKPGLILDATQEKPSIGLQAAIVLVGMPAETVRFDSKAIIELKPLAFRFVGEGIFLDTLSLMRASGDIETKPLLAKFQSTTKDPTGMLVLEQSGRIEGTVILVGGSMSAFGTRVGEAQARIDANPNRLIMDVTGRAKLILGQAEASLHSVNIINDLAFEANLSGLKIGSWSVSGLEVHAGSSWATVAFTVSGVRLSISTQTLEDIDEDALLDAILAMFRWDLEDLVEALKDPSFNLGSPVGGGSGEGASKKGDGADGPDTSSDNAGAQAKSAAEGPVASADGSAPPGGPPGAPGEAAPPSTPTGPEIESRAGKPAEAFAGTAGTGTSEQGGSPGPCVVRFQPAGSSCLLKLTWCGANDLTVNGPYPATSLSGLSGSTLISTEAPRAEFDLSLADSPSIAGSGDSEVSFEVARKDGARTLRVRYNVPQPGEQPPVEVVVREDDSLVAVHAAPFASCETKNSVAGSKELAFGMSALLPGWTPSSFRGGSAKLARADARLLAEAARAVLLNRGLDEFRLMEIPPAGGADAATRVYLIPQLANRDAPAQFEVLSRRAPGRITLPSKGPVGEWLKHVSANLGQQPTAVSQGEPGWHGLITRALTSPPSWLKVYPNYGEPRLLTWSGSANDSGPMLFACNASACDPWSLTSGDWEASAMSSAGLSQQLSDWRECSDSTNRWVALATPARSGQQTGHGLDTSEVAIVAPQGLAGEGIAILTFQSGVLRKQWIELAELEAAWQPYEAVCGTLESTSDWSSVVATMRSGATSKAECPAPWFLLRSLLTDAPPGAALCK